MSAAAVGRVVDAASTECAGAGGSGVVTLAELETPLCDCWPVCFDRPVTLCRVETGYPLEPPEVLLQGDRDVIERDWAPPAASRGGHGRNGQAERHDRWRRRLVAALEYGGGFLAAYLAGSWLLGI